MEAVSELTTDAFLAAFRRFVARRGTCSNLHSDCGKNFVGADRELNELLVKLQKQHPSLAESLANIGTIWHFIPPGSPSFGGIWEAGVKQTKHHLRRVQQHYHVRRIVNNSFTNRILPQFKTSLRSN